MISILILLAAQPLSRIPIDRLTDAELCTAAFQIAGNPALRVEDVGPFDFQGWEVDCESRRLLMPVRILDERVTEELLVAQFDQPDFCDAPNLKRFWQRGWRFEMKFHLTDGRVRNLRTCG